MWAAKNAKDRCGQSINLDTLRRLGVRLIAEEGYGSLLGGKDPNSGMTSVFCTMTMSLALFASSRLRNPVQKKDHAPYSPELFLALSEIKTIPRKGKELLTFLKFNAT
jgi:hypothetical protein